MCQHIAISSPQHLRCNMTIKMMEGKKTQHKKNLKHKNNLVVHDFAIIK
jgi:hypothetical protein